jgi:hypothetical protein
MERISSDCGMLEKLFKKFLMPSREDLVIHLDYPPSISPEMIFRDDKE